MTSKLDRDLIKHASEKLAAAARRRVREGDEPASAARAAIRETQALFPHGWRLGVQGDDGDDVVEVWEVEHKAAEPIAVVARKAARKAHATKKIAKDIEDAVHAAQLYIGKGLSLRISDEQKLYNRMNKKIASAAKRRGMDEGDAYQQIMAEAKRRGGITPMPGKDI